MDRRRFLLTSLAGAVAAPIAAGAQQPDRVARVGVLSVGEVLPWEEIAKSPLMTSLRSLGWIAGQNIIFEPRFAEGQTDRLPALAADLVRLKVDVIVTLTNQETLAAKQVTSSIPIVMLLGARPVEAGLVASLARPGGNVTGVTVAPIAGGKYLELLREALPNLKRVAILVDPTFPGHTPPKLLEADAQRLGLTLVFIGARQPEDVLAAFERIIQERPDALLVALTGPLLGRMRDIIAFAAEHRLPTFFPGARTAVDAGGLMSYGYDYPPLFRRAAWYIDRVLKGTRPADLPIEQPTKFELVINLKTAKALGLTISPSLLARADLVIE